MWKGEGKKSEVVIVPVRLDGGLARRGSIRTVCVCEASCSQRLGKPWKTIFQFLKNVLDAMSGSSSTSTDREVPVRPVRQVSVCR